MLVISRFSQLFDSIAMALYLRHAQSTDANLFAFSGVCEQLGLSAKQSIQIVPGLNQLVLKLQSHPSLVA